jgi:3-oxoacyl-[acyl-carrier-protein] synthase-3
VAFSEIKNVRIAGISACVPKNIEENSLCDLFDSSDEAKKFIETTGVERRHWGGQKDIITTSDLCFHAATKLLDDLKWNRSDIDCLVLVTQTPDYQIPATACILQDRLKLNRECFAFDINLGCSGWVSGLSVIGNLLSSGCMKKGLLLSGDVSALTISPYDKSAYPLFGDAGTVTAVEFIESIGTSESNNFKFHQSTDGSGYKYIMIPDGGLRGPVSSSSFVYEEFNGGIKRNKLQMVLEGMDVFMFGISKAPESVNKLFDHFSIQMEDIDLFVFHQANLLMNEKIRKILKIPENKVIHSLKNFGNTSSASIPLTLVTEKGPALRTKPLHIVACGFGIGLSWGTVSFHTDKLVCPDLIEV